MHPAFGHNNKNSSGDEIVVYFLPFQTGISDWSRAAQAPPPCLPITAQATRWLVPGPGLGIRVNCQDAARGNDRPLCKLLLRLWSASCSGERGTVNWNTKHQTDSAVSPLCTSDGCKLIKPGRILFWSLPSLITLRYLRVRYRHVLDRQMRCSPATCCDKVQEVTLVNLKRLSAQGILRGIFRIELLIGGMRWIRVRWTHLA